ncbi:MAG: hypothetical protein GY841_18175 [FCB group bacterium]|nr:hypothetical protein [FCB group bacterium]
MSKYTKMIRVYSGSIRSRHEWQLIILLLVLVSGVYIFHLAHYGNYIIDDAGISYTYARNLADGYGLVFNIGGEKVEGYSNPLWVFVLASLIKLRLFDPVLTPKFISVLLNIFSFFMIFRFFRDLRPGIPAIITAFFVSMTLALNVSLTVWSGAGLENALYGFLILLGGFRLYRELSGSTRYALTGFIFFLIAITRPEGIVYAAAGGLAGLILLRRGRSARFMIINTLIFLGCFFLYHLWHYQYFAEWLPNTYYAKQRNVPLVYRLTNLEWHGWTYIKNCISDYRLYLLLPLAGLGYFRRPRGPILIFTALILVSLALVVVTGADWMMQYRLLHPFIMLIIVSAGLGCFLIISEPRRKSRFKWVLMAVSITAFAIINNSNIDQIRKVDQYKTVHFLGVKRTYHAFTHALADTLMVSNPTLFAADLGATGYFGGLTVYDAGLLTDYHLARYRYRDFFGDYLFDERKPDFLGRQGGAVARLTHLWENPDLRSLYLIYDEGEVAVNRYGPGIIDGRYIRKGIILKDRLSHYAQPASIQFSNGLRLAGYTLPPVVDSAADRISLALYWDSPTSADDTAHVSLLLMNTASDIILDSLVFPGYDWYRPIQWKDTALVCQNLFIPREYFPDDTSIIVALADGADRWYVLDTLVFGQSRYEKHLSTVIDSSLSITKDIPGYLWETMVYLRRLNRDIWDSPTGKRLVANYVDVYLGKFRKPLSPTSADSVLKIVELLKRLDPVNRDIADYGFSLHEYYCDCASNSVSNTWWQYPQAFDYYQMALGADASDPRIRKEIELIRPWADYIHRHPELINRFPKQLPLCVLLDIYREFLRGSRIQKQYFHDLMIGRLINDEQVQEEIAALSIMDRMHLHQLGFVDGRISACYLDDSPKATFGGNTLEMPACRLLPLASGKYLFEAIFIPHYLPARKYALSLNISGESPDVLPEQYRFRGSAPLSIRTIPDLCDLPDNSPAYVYKIIELTFRPVKFEVIVYVPGGPPWYPLHNDNSGDNFINVEVAGDKN